MHAVTFRQTTPDDLPALTDLYAAAFPGEDLMGVVTALLLGCHDILSVAAHQGEGLLGHVLLTRCDTDDAGRAGALLGPLAVHPEAQRQGLGTRLLDHAFAQLARDGACQVFVLGDPAYYGRFRFRAETQVTPPYPLPEQWAGAWQSRLLDGDAALDPGPLRLPAPWRVAALWAP